MNITISCLRNFRKKYRSEDAELPVFENVDEVHEILKLSTLRDGQWGSGVKNRWWKGGVSGVYRLTLCL